MALFATFAAGTADAATFTVTNLADSGAGSLRQAILDAEIAAGADTIDFQDGLAGTIVLASSLPEISGNLSVIGPGADLLTVSGDGQVRPISISAGTDVMISGLTIADGFAVPPANEVEGNGGGIRNEGSLEIRDCIISGNASSEFGSGGGIYNTGTLLVDGTTIELNSADTGAGIANGGTLEVRESTIRNNAAAAIDGGISNAGNAVVRRSLIADNTAEFGGGIGNATMLTVVNSTLSGNAAAGGAASSGGAIDNFGGTVELLHATLADNSAPIGSGVFTDGDFTAKNSLVSDNNGADCATDGGTFEVVGKNFDTDGTCGTFATTSSLALALEPLADNGGPTFTHGLAESSVVVNTALDCTGLDGSTPVEVDQRGVERPLGVACEPGSFESPATDLVFADGFE